MKIVIDGRPYWINYHHLYCFHVVVEEGGLTRAAARLGIGQSALSIQMKQFEQSLGFALLDRAHRSITPNERGRLVHAYTREIFRLGGEMVETLLDRPTARRTQLEVAALDTIPKHFTVELVRQALAPGGCTVKVLEGKPDALLENLIEHRVDLMISNFVPTAEPGRIHARRIARLPLWVVGARSFVRFKKGFPGSLHRAPFVLPTGDSGVRHAFESYCRDHSLTPDLVVEAQDVMVQKLLAVQGTGLTVVPEFAVSEYLAQRKLFAMGKLEGLHEELFLISAARKIQNPVAQRLMKAFRVS
jgi:LysR family transcriptional activator of nhaA